MPGRPRICIFDANGSITNIDPAAEQLAGCPPGAALGRPVTEVFPFIDLKRARESIGDPTHVAFERADGTRSHLTHSLLTAPGGGGAIALIETPRRDSAVSELMDAERQNRLLFEQNPFPTWVYDVNSLEFLDVNPAAIAQYGYSREEFLAMTLKDIRPDEDVPAMIEAVKRNAFAFRSEGRWRHKRKGGQIITVDVAATATVYRDRRAKLAVIQDVTEREESERRVGEATALIDAIANTVPLAIWGADLAGNVNFWNRKAEELFGWREVDVLGARPPCIVPDQLCETTAERALIRRDGAVVYCDVWDAALRDPRGNKIGSIAVAADTTDRRRNEQQLAAYVQSLARSNDDLRQFAYAASHDLQEPLRNVRLFAELLGELEVAEHEHGREYLAHVQRGAKQIQDLVRGLRTYWELGETMPDLRNRVDGRAVLKRVLAVVRGELQTAGATVKVEWLPVLLGNEEEIATVFAELLRNAIRFRGRRPLEIEIRARHSSPGSSHSHSAEPYEISVSDNGVGISPLYGKRIFEIFKRLSRAHEGIGIGLAVVKRIVERHGGRIWVESEEGHGSAFHFTWPAAEEEAVRTFGGRDTRNVEG